MTRRRTSAPGPGQIPIPLDVPWPTAVRRGWRRRWHGRPVVTVRVHGGLL